MHICMLLLAKYQERNQPVTGVDLQAITQIRALKEAGHDVTVLAKKRNLQSKIYEMIDGIQVYRIGPSGLYWFWTALILWRLRRDLDVVHILGQRVTTFVSIFLCRLLAIPTVIKIPITHNKFSWRQFHKAMILKLENLISRHASAYIAISEEIADQLTAEGFYPERIKRLPNGVDMKRFFTATDIGALRGELGLPAGKKIVLFSGRLITRKGYDLVLAAWPQIYAACPAAHLVVVGGGSKESITALGQLGAETGGGSVTYVGSVLNPAPYLAASDVYFFPSRREGLPNALLEAMACSCACVASDIGGCVDLIIPQQTGLLFPSGDARAAAAATIRLLRDESLAQAVGRGANALIAAKYEIHSVAKRLIAIYRSLQTTEYSYDFAYPNNVLEKEKKILLLAPHNDDEALACAGIVAHSTANGAKIKVVVITNGDNKGRKMALIRIRETIKAMTYLGLGAKHIVILGYGNTGKESDSFINRLYCAATDNTVVASKVGTESYSIPGNPEYHYQTHGVHAKYDKATFRQDLRSVIEEFNPDHIFVSSQYDSHPDHAVLHRFTVESIINIKRDNPEFSPMMHEYLVHSYDGDDYWPTRDRNGRRLAAFSKPATLDTETLLDWEKREIFTVPLAMQPVSRSKNKKHIVISKYRSQRPSRNNNYLYSYVKSDEVFWKKDFSNIALLASVSVSSESTAGNQLGIKVIDGFIDGYPRFPGNEWATIGEAAGAWVKLSWPRPHIVNKIILFGRPNSCVNITSAVLDFSDGSSLKVGVLPENGGGYELDFAPKTIEWVKLTVDTAVGEDTGLSEFEVYEALGG